MKHNLPQLDLVLNIIWYEVFKKESIMKVLIVVGDSR